MPESAVSPNRSVLIVLAYLWVLAVIPMFLDDSDAEVRWHAKHGLVLTAAELILLFVYLSVTSVIALSKLALGVVLLLFIVFAWVGVLAVHVIAILKGVNGGRLIIPGISEYANRF